ncbi:hypothetical protein [Flavobacterium luminosum]|uniref:Uncharacterized protein n=1 Tax=Flavobacterium luminosum TaxID=2949086 RepID=A0ABT0TQW6_9FLAO|nr:hypothetical protein [Flavobacterium sp. HXWNR70]MCL9809885.1 hypothetical protein [Flavobacterium sp. HXWNR70]
MILLINAKTYSFISKVELTEFKLNQKIENYVSTDRFSETNELIDKFSTQFNLMQHQIIKLESELNDKNIQYVGFVPGKFSEFSSFPIYLDIKNTRGKLIYWKDWDYIFQKIEDKYYLWCFLGGIADIQREIELSDEQTQNYHNLGIEYIDRLITDLKKLNDSETYKKAIEENREVYKNYS